MLLLLVMTIAELLTDCSRNLSTVPASMSSTQQRWLVQAVNEGLAEFVAGLPDHRRTEVKVERLAATVTKDITVTASSRTIAFAPSWADQSAYLGRTVVVGNDSSRYNRLQALNTLMVHHEGATGSTTLEVRSDAIQLGYLEDAVEGQVMLLWETGSQMLEYGIPDWSDETKALKFEIGTPERWWVESLNGLTGGGTPLYILRLWPQPDAVYSVRFQRRLWPTAITTAMLASTTELPVLPAEEATVVAFCEENLKGSQLWLGSASKEDATLRYQRARSLHLEKTNARKHTFPAKIRTKKGY